MPTRSRPWYRLKRNTIPAAALGAGMIVAVVASFNPWPAALLIRAAFTQGAISTTAEMAPYAPTGLDEQLGVSYSSHNDSHGESGTDTTLDTFSPAGTTHPLPTVVWIHGGAWISGAKENVDPYVKIIAAEGYTTVSVNYTVSPEAIYPEALMQLNSALAFLVAHATDYNIDASRISIAGDSAGAQLTSQLAAAITNPAFAAQTNLQPALTPDQLAGVILNCGIYDVSGIPNAPGIGGWGFRIALWSYLGQKDWSATDGSGQMSTINAVTRDFPRTWISGGNGDPLTDSQSKPLAERLGSLGVPVTALFYGADHSPALPHEYQFHLDTPDARTALDSTLAFLKETTG